MKVYLGPYIKYWGPYQLAELLQQVGFSETSTYAIGQALANIEPLCKICEWIDSKRERKVIIKYDNYDVWNLDHSLSLIIVTGLKKFAEKLNGHPCDIPDEDVPEEMRFGKKDDTGMYINTLDRWKYCLNEMIFGFEYDFDDAMDNGATLEEAKEGMIRAAEGRRLFAKYFNNLWD